MDKQKSVSTSALRATVMALALTSLPEAGFGQTELLPQPENAILASGEISARGDEQSGWVSANYFQPLLRMSDAALLFEAASDINWDDHLVGSASLGLVYRTRLGNGATLGLNSYVDIGTVNNRPMGLVSVGVEYQPAMRRQGSLRFGGNFYQAFADYTDPVAYETAYGVPRTGLDLYVEHQQRFFDNVTIGLTGGVFAYEATDFAVSLTGARLDLDASVMLSERLTASSSLGLRFDDQRQSPDLLASIGLRWTFGNGGQPLESTISSSGLLPDASQRPPLIVRPASAGGTSVPRPVRHVGFGNLFTPVFNADSDLVENEPRQQRFTLQASIQGAAANLVQFFRGTFELDGGRGQPMRGSLDRSIAIDESLGTSSSVTFRFTTLFDTDDGTAGGNETFRARPDIARMFCSQREAPGRIISVTIDQDLATAEVSGFDPTTPGGLQCSVIFEPEFG